MKIRIANRTGRLVEGLIYRIHVPIDIDLNLTDPSRSGQRVISRMATPCDEYDVIAEVCVRSISTFGCPVNPTHETSSRVVGVTWTDLYGGNRHGQFVADSIGESVVVTEQFATELASQGFKGVGFTHLPVRVNQSLLDGISLCRVDFSGRGCLRPMQYVLPKPNECPFCGFGPVVCSGCHDLMYRCQNCKRDLIEVEESPKKCPFVAESFSDANCIFNGEEWDGSDFLSGRGMGFVTQRVLRWLTSIHAAPFIAEPCLVDIEKMSRQQLSELTEDKRN